MVKTIIMLIFKSDLTILLKLCSFLLYFDVFRSKNSCSQKTTTCSYITKPNIKNILQILWDRFYLISTKSRKNVDISFYDIFFSVLNLLATSSAKNPFSTQHHQCTN